MEAACGLYREWDVGTGKDKFYSSYFKFLFQLSVNSYLNSPIPQLINHIV